MCTFGDAKGSKEEKGKTSKEEQVEERCVSVNVNQHGCSRQSYYCGSHMLDPILLDTVVAVSVTYFRILYMRSVWTSPALFPAAPTPTHPVQPPLKCMPSSSCSSSMMIIICHIYIHMHMDTYIHGSIPILYTYRLMSYLALLVGVCV